MQKEIIIQTRNNNILNSMERVLVFRVTESKGLQPQTSFISFIYSGKCRFACLQEYLCRLETVSTVFEEILEHISKENMAKGKKKL